MENHSEASKAREKIIRVQGNKAYLLVADRIVWFREDHPLWSIETEFNEITEESAFAQCTILEESGRIIATAHKFCAKGKPPSDKYYREMAETGAMGRALATLGYGTAAAFAGDESDDFIADAPIERPLQSVKKPSDMTSPSGAKITGPQMKRLFAIAKKNNYDEVAQGKLLQLKWGFQDSRWYLPYDTYDAFTKFMDENPYNETVFDSK